MVIVTYISIIPLNVNGLNAPTIRHRLAEWMKNKTHIYAVYNRPTSDLWTHTDWVSGWKKIFNAKGNKKKAGVAILISDKINLK